MEYFQLWLCFVKAAQFESSRTFWKKRAVAEMLRFISLFAHKTTAFSWIEIVKLPQIISEYCSY